MFQAHRTDTGFIKQHQTRISIPKISVASGEIVWRGGQSRFVRRFFLNRHEKPRQRAARHIASIQLFIAPASHQLGNGYRTVDVPPCMGIQYNYI